MRNPDGLLPVVASLGLLVAACTGSQVAPTPLSAPAGPTTIGSPSPLPSATPAGATASLTHVPVSYSSISSDTLPLWIALEAGIFRDDGLDVELTLGASSTTMQILLAGQADLASVGGGETVSAVASGADLVYAATIAGAFPFALVTAPDIATVQDLKGKSFGVSTVGGQDYTAAEIVLDKYGLDLDSDTAVTQVGLSAARIASLQSGAVQATLLDFDYVDRAEAQGDHVLVDLTEEGIPAAQTGIVANRSWVSGHPAVMQAFVDSLIQGLTREQQDKPLALEVLKRYYNSDDEAEMERIYDYGVKNQLRPPYPKVDQFTGIVQALGKRNDRVSAVDLNRLIDTSFVDNAVSHGLSGD